MKPVRVGFLGTGWIASAHAKSALKVPGVQVTALCNRHIDKAHSFNTTHLGGAATCYADLAQMLQQEKLDALYICMPPGAHAGEAEMAAARGLHLLLEKPIALTAERGASIAAAVKKAGVVCQIGHHMRHTGPVMKLKQMIADGTAGKPVLMQGRFFTNALFPAWWRNPDLGGGQLVEQAIHLYDLARHFLGDAETVTAFADNLLHRKYDDYRVDDLSAATIRFAAGGIASLCASNCADPVNGSITFTVLCEKVMVEFQNPDTATFAYHGGLPAEEIRRTSATVTRETVQSAVPNFDELSADFIAAIRTGRPPRSSVEDGLKGLQLVLAAKASALAGGMPQRLVP